MIVHKIKSPNKILQLVKEAIPGVKKRFRAGSEEHKQAILQGAIKGCPFQVGDTVMAWGDEIGEVYDILDQQGACDWEGYKPKFIGVWHEKWQCTIFYHTTELEWAR